MTEETEDRELETLLEYLRDTRGFDFTGYKRGSLGRRIGKRMEAVGIPKYTDYLDYLQVHPDEFVHLFNYILINVTGFFRDSQIWDYLAEAVLPRIVEGVPERGGVRVWCAGVASGEEAYSVAMLLAEIMGGSAFPGKVKIYATDVDDEALVTARQASYPQKQVEPIPPALLDKYFERVGSNYVFDKELRRSVIFGRHDLVQDAPISKVDLLVCRNTLMYFNSETQSKIFEHFQFAVNEGGFLLLGKAEMLFTDVQGFKPVDLKRRVFTRIPSEGGPPQPLVATAQEGQFTNHLRSREAAFQSGPVPEIMIDRNGYLRMANAKARAMFGLQGRDIGKPFKDLELSYQPVELRSHVDRAANSRQTAKIPETKLGDAYFEIEIVPLLESGTYLGAVITFEDVTRYRELQDELERSSQELETAMEELQSTNEELETTNEELQSTNEELETMNEELQSTNEELSTVNEELRGRSEELTELNSFLESILSSVENGVVVLDDELRIQVWNDRAMDLWGLRADEVEGRSFLNLDIGLPVEELRSGLRASLTGRDGGVYRTEVEAINRRGKAITCRVTATPRRGPGGEVRGLTILMEELDHQGS